MALQVALNHRTSYHYDRDVELGAQLIRLRPAPHCRTPIVSYSLTIQPADHFLNWQQDPQGNFLARLVVPEKTRIFSVEVDLVAEMAVINPFDFFLAPDASEFPFRYDPLLSKDLQPFLEPEPAGQRLRTRLAAVPRTPQRTMDFLVDLNQRLEQEIDYVIRMEPGIQSCEETLELGRGSCRDTAWLLVQLLRHLGLAARFTSGYLIQLKPDVAALDGPSGTEEDFTDLHAWAEVYIPGAGWVGLDPTSGLLAGEGHIPLACTPDPPNAAPITGTVDPGEVEFGFSMSVTRVLESPRVTKPYSGDQWRAILTTGERVDARLNAGDVRLTMGGEPTFVAIDDPDEPEWNTDAVGPAKRALAAELIHRLRDRFAPDGLLHFGQGKWYPGEPLPRWAFSLHWRGDGQPLWRDASLIADEKPSEPATIAQAERFMLGLADRLAVPADHVMPAYEDPLVFVAKEQTLPPNVDPADSKLDDPEERARLARVFEHGLGRACGFVLPVQRWQSRDRRSWRSERWNLRRGRLMLIPGDSPVGYRLPLGSLPHLDEDVYPHILPTDPFATRHPLPVAATLMQPRGTGSGSGAGPSADDAEEEPVRTAISIEPRDGHLCIFLPPLEAVDDYVDLLAAVEATAASEALPVHVEGYPPPDDPRVHVIKVTPDPGVIEVNIHPATSWDQQVATTEALYEEARLTRLAAEKFMLDGQHTGTGGGNHVVLGGATPADSPFLRRPDLLASLVTYWQNHPSLSYLFSGRFIGPTSQAPRVDEARNDSLYELEIALAQVPAPGAGDCPPWLVDRLFRHLLIDVSGNTHRAEICIDKLYSPDGPTGRLGLVEFRAFEMPPHPRMSLVQQLLMRALIAFFWDQPYRNRLVRWGTGLHDRFMLPHFVWADFLDVLSDLQSADLKLEPEWFAPHFEFRFPVSGKIQTQNISLELRQALEPWHVLGEETQAGTTARYVDSSLERLQVRVDGLSGDRYAVTCNGRTLPLAPTGRAGEAIAGVRYRAWQPPSCLHPNIGVHTPLVFDLVDRWTGRSLGGCRYHVAHPGGRNFDTLPRNSYEAEGRRLARFESIGHTPGPMTAGAAVVDPDFPYTLDLRRPT